MRLLDFLGRINMSLLFPGSFATNVETDERSEGCRQLTPASAFVASIQTKELCNKSAFAFRETLTLRTGLVWNTGCNLRASL